MTRVQLLFVTGAAAAALVLGAAGARAQDADRPFTGTYIGPEVGVSIVDTGGGSSAEFLYGGRLGYRYQSASGWVLGIEGRAGDTTFSQSGSLLGVPITTKLGRSLGAVALIGYALGPGRRHLLFVGGGIDNTRITVRAGNTTSGATNTVGTVTAGYEWAASARLSLRLGGEIVKPNGVREVRITGGLFLRF